ncbi:hypothetical protein PHOSAC3_90664 [Mesotoga infera]|nr:hypothetical protein PHOSAC3_90664 [Mesotoga infera]
MARQDGQIDFEDEDCVIRLFMDHCGISWVSVINRLLNFPTLTDVCLLNASSERCS